MILLRIRVATLVTGICLLLSAETVVRAEASVPPIDESAAEIRELLSARFGTGYHDIGVVVGIIGPSGRRVITYGTSAEGHSRPITLDGDTVFEIGSITKTFTGLLLADMIEKGEVHLDDPVQRYLPALVQVPSRNGHQITLEELITNSSGLPDNPLSVNPTRYTDFHRGFAASADQLYDILNRYHLKVDPGTPSGHSNIGVGLLGIALARRAGLDYEQLLETRITGPLRMTSTAVTQTPDMVSRRALPHDAYLRPEVDLDMGALVGAGAIKSTANDMLKFLAAELDYSDNPLRKAMATQITAVRVPLGDLQMALQVVISKGVAGELVWTNGGTFGQQSFVGFDPQRRLGIVALINMSGGARLVDDIGMHILAGTPVAKIPPPPPPPPVRRAVAIDAVLLDRYIGRYELTPAMSITVSRNGPRLFAQITGQDNYEIFPENATTFFWTVVDAQATFEVDSSGHAADMVLLEGGQSMVAKRVRSTPN